MFAHLQHDKPTVLHQRAFGVGKLIAKAQERGTCVENLYQQGCAKIRLPKTHDQSLQAVMINSSGGLTGGDKVRWEFELGSKTKTTITTQACERIYDSSGGSADVNVDLKVESKAQLAWLPQETILFDGGGLKRSINAQIAPDSEVLVVEPIVIGRQAMGEKVSSGIFKDHWRIHQNDRLVHAEDFLLENEISSQLAQPFITNGHEVFATILLISAKAEGQLETVRELIGETGGASFWNGKLLARITAQDGYSLRKRLIPIINRLNFGAAVPKVWSL